MTAFQIEDPIFKTATLFVMDLTFPEFVRYMRKHFKHIDVGIDVNHAGEMFTFRDHPPWRLIWCLHRPDTYERLGNLTHELLHLVTRICQDKGIPIKAQLDEGSGDETAAYLLDYFVREAVRKSQIRLMRR